MSLNFNLYSVNYIWYLNNGKEQYNKREQLQQRGKGEVGGKVNRVVNDKQEDRGQPTETTTTETTTDKGGERQGSSNKGKGIIYMRVR